MRNIIIVFLSIYSLNSLYAQSCSSPNSAVNPNYCCGHDPELTSQSSNHHVFNWPGGASNFCGWLFFEQANSPPTYSTSGNWMLVWGDEFNDYTKLNESFYSPVSQIAYNINDGGEAYGFPYSSNTQAFLYMHDPDLIKINQNGNGKLQLFENYDANPSKMTQRYVWGQPESGVFMHSDYTVGHLETKFRFPQNCKIQGNIKTYPVSPIQWPAFWTFGDNGIELDLFEMPYSTSYLNNQHIISTFHFKEYGLPATSLNAEGLLHFTGWTFNLNDNLHKYELIWDNWSLQWLLDGNRYHRINRFYKLYSSWSSNVRKKFYRSRPVNNSFDYDNHGDQLFAQNKFFPGFFYTKPDPVMIILNNQLFTDHAPLSPAFIDPNQSMDLDYLRVWVKADCEADRNVNSDNINIAYQGQNGTPVWPYYTSWVNRHYLETGGNLTFINGSNVTLDASQLGLFVATNQIAFENGFSVKEGASMFSFISYCETSSDNREGTDELDSLVEDDGTPYYTPDGIIDETDLLHQQSNGRVFTNELDTESNGIIDMPTNTTANNTNLYNDIIIKTEESGFAIESTGAKIIGFELLDSKGSKILKETDSTLSSYKISRQIISQGIYTCIIYTTNGIDVRKIWVWR